MHLKILVVENEVADYENLISILTAIPNKDKSDWKIETVTPKRATTVEDATKKLQNAASRSEVFDLVVLDLSIPSDSIGDEHVENGFEVLSRTRKLRAAKQIVIYTRFASDRNILRALREGATDFVEKPRPRQDEQELQTRFLACWQRILENESANLLEERIKNLVPHAEAGLAQRFTACFSSFLQKVAHTAEDVQHYAVERFGLDPEKDSQDYLIRSLKNQDDDIKSVQRHWVNLNADLIDTNGSLKPEPLGALLDGVAHKWSPSLVVKNCNYENEFQDGETAGILTFHDDVRLIIQEVVAGALSTLPDYGAKHWMKVNAKVDDGQAVIRFSDNLVNDEQRLSLADAQAINEGSILGPYHNSKRFGRAWGLSVAQHLALRGGGRLIVQPQSDGNVITYFAPLE